LIGELLVRDTRNACQGAQQLLLRLKLKRRYWVGFFAQR
jgi:hypothetical protein